MGIYITFQNGSKITDSYESSLMVGGEGCHNVRNRMKGGSIGKAEKHCSKQCDLTHL